MSTILRELGDRYSDWIDRREVAWELVMAALAVLFVVVGFIDDVPTDQAAILDIVDMGLTLVFLAEFTTRFAASRNRRHYLRRHWVDAVALVPTVRALRLLRLLRLLRMVRVFAGVFRALSRIERFAAHRGLLALFGAWLTTVAICGTAIYFAESSVNEHLTSFGDAIWFAVVTVATVGYGDVTPITPEGRLAAALLIVIGITLWAAITGMITSLLVSTNSSETSIPELIRQLSELRQDDVLSEVEFDSKKAELLARL
jgi:voltage-gated potassium channel